MRSRHWLITIAAGVDYCRPGIPALERLVGVGVFCGAAGDARHGSVKRVAGAVGEGSVAVGSVHQYLAGLAARVAGVQ